jgi:hypothetical protein
MPRTRDFRPFWGKSRRSYAEKYGNCFAPALGPEILPPGPQQSEIPNNSATSTRTQFKQVWFDLLLVVAAPPASD